MYNTRISNLSMLGVGVGTGLNSVERSNRKIHGVESFKIWYHKVTILQYRQHRTQNTNTPSLWEGFII